MVPTHHESDSPSCSDGIGGTDNAYVEHASYPELAAHKVAERNSDEKADGEEPCIVHDHRDQEDGGGEHEHDDGAAEARSHDVEDGPHAHTAGDGADDGCDTAKAGSCLGQGQILADERPELRHAKMMIIMVWEDKKHEQERDEI